MTLRGKASFGAVLGIGWLAGFAPSAAHAQATPPVVDAAPSEGTTEAVAAPPDGEGADPAGGHAAPREAVELFQRAREEYRTGRYQDAATMLESIVARVERTHGASHLEVAAPLNLLAMKLEKACNGDVRQALGMAAQLVGAADLARELREPSSMISAFRNVARLQVRTCCGA
jgi:hypothetical protein